MKIEGKALVTLFTQKANIGNNVEKKPESITGVNVFAVLSNLGKLAKKEGTVPFTFTECTEGLPVPDKASTPNKHRDLILSGDSKTYRISIYPDAPKLMQIEDWRVAEGQVRTLVFEGNSLKKTSKMIKTISIKRVKGSSMTDVITDEKSIIFTPGDFTAEEQTLFLEKVSGAKVDIEATIKLQEEVLRDRAKAETTRKLKEASPFLSPQETLSCN